MGIGLASDDWRTMLLRLGIAACCGGLIGLNRHSHRHAAGIRTQMLVSSAAALLTLTILMAASSDPTANGSRVDALSRVMQGIASGVGFIGAGEILRESTPERPRIHGITTAAATWIAAAIGIASGCGLLWIAALGTAIALLTLALPH